MVYSQPAPPRTEGGGWTPAIGRRETYSWAYEEAICSESASRVMSVLQIDKWAGPGLDSRQPGPLNLNVNIR